MDENNRSAVEILTKRKVPLLGGTCLTTLVFLDTLFFVALRRKYAKLFLETLAEVGWI